MKNLAIKQSTGGARSTRSEVLRQLALKKKIAENPLLQKKFKKMTREEASALGLDPMVNNNSSNEGSPMVGRIRNKRGEYQTLDSINGSL